MKVSAGRVYRSGLKQSLALIVPCAPQRTAEIVKPSIGNTQGEVAVNEATNGSVNERISPSVESL